MITSYFPIIRFTAFGAALALIGCTTHTAPIQTFATATDSLATDARQGYLFLDDTLKKKQICEAALHPELPVTGKIFEGMMTGNRRLDSRTELLKHLAEYAAALERFGSRDFKKEMTTTSKSLTESLFRLKISYEASSGSKLALTKTDMGLLANLAANAGTVWIKLKRKEQLKIIVMQADPAIQQVVTLLKSEFAEMGPVVERELEWVETALEKGYNLDASKLDYQKRIEILTAIQVTHDNTTPAGKLFVTLSSATGRMGKAHATLAVALEKNELNTPEFIAAIEDLAQQAQSVKDLIKSLK